VAAAETPVKAEIALYRILGVRDDYLSSRSDREGDHDLVFENSPRADDSTRVVIGGRPEEYISAWRQAWALIIASLKYQSKWTDADDVVQARDDFCDHIAAEVDLPEQLAKDCGLWVTVRVSRPCVVTPAAQGRYFWARYSEISALSDEFVSDVADHVDLLMAVIGAETGLSLDVPVVTNNRAMVFVEGRAPFMLPTMTAMAASLSVGQRWDALQPELVAERVKALDVIPGRIRDHISRAFRWLTLSEQDADSLRSFLFGYVGLEGLSQGLVRDLRRVATARLQAGTDHHFPVDDLIWPLPADANREPGRSALFSFAVLATALSPKTSVDDTDRFRELQKDRQRIAHGKDHTLETFPVGECQVLLRRYISLVSNYEWKVGDSPRLAAPP
jgi:hypothetical protein